MSSSNSKHIGIMFVINELRHGGAEHVLFDLAEGLREGGKYRPIVACLRLAGVMHEQFEQAGIKVYQRLLRDRYDVVVLWRMLEIIRRENVKVIVAVGSGGNRMFWSSLAGKLAGIKVVVWSHTYSQERYSEFELATRVLFPLVDRVVALGERHKRCIMWRDKGRGGRISVIGNGIRIDRFEHPQWRDKARAKLGLADENVTAIAMIANLRRSKRHDIFIESAKKVVANRRDVHFFIIGDGPNRESVRQLVQESELQGQFLSFIGHRDDLHELLPGIDIVCICSEYQECLSLVAIQSMAAGAVVVSNVIGSMDELIEDGKTGFFYHPLDSESLAGKLIYVMEHADLRKEVIANAREKVKSKFCVERMIGDFCELFDELSGNTYRSEGIIGIGRLIG